MRKRFIFLLIIYSIVFVFSGCRIVSPQEKVKIDTLKTLKEIEEVRGIQKINGFKAENNRFYFTGVEENAFNFYHIDLTSMELTKEHSSIAAFVSFIPLGEGEAILIDENGQLFLRDHNSDILIDSNISMEQGPNIVVSPGLNKAVYTKGPKENSDLYLFIIGEEPRLIKKAISQEAFSTFSYTTIWSKLENYFIFNNSEIYNSNGTLYDTINASSISWAPNDDYISFIRMPEDKKGNRVFSSHWESYVGEEFAIYYVNEKTDETIYKNQEGLVNVFEDIKWSEDNSKTSISVGEINRAQDGAFESMKYNHIVVYDILKELTYEIKDMPYNYYDFMFNEFIYGSNLGQRDVIEIAEIHGDYRGEFKNPKILNNIDMFFTYYKDKGYILSNRDLIQFDSRDIKHTSIVKTFPWDISSIHLEPESEQFVVINKENQLFVLKIQEK